MFFTEYVRSAGRDLDWSAIDTPAVHAARHVSAHLKQDYRTYLAAQLEPGIRDLGAADPRALSNSMLDDYSRDPNEALVIYDDMVAYIIGDTLVQRGGLTRNDVARMCALSSAESETVFLSPDRRLRTV